MQRRIWTALAAVATCTGGAAFAQVVDNPGFEDPVLQNTDGLQNNWGTFYGGADPVILVAIEDATQARTGLQSFHVRVANNLNAFCGAAQTVTGVSPNISYDFKFWGKKGADTNPIGTGGTNGIDVKIEWKNACGVIVGAVAVAHPILTDNWQQFTLTATAPADAAGASLVFAVQSYTFLNPATAGAEAFFDDVEFVVSANQAGIGTCCAAGGVCSITTLTNCSVAGGTWNGASQVCEPNPCPGAPGACCNPDDGQCVVTTPSICSTLGGSFSGSGVACTPTLCPIGCSADFNGTDGVTADDIFAFLDSWFAQNGACP